LQVAVGELGDDPGKKVTGVNPVTSDLSLAAQRRLADMRKSSGCFPIAPQSLTCLRLLM
jgi:hypothetical protein